MSASFSNAARNLRQIGSSPVSWALALTILAIHWGVSAAGGPGRLPAQAWFETFALSRTAVLNGEFWQVLSYGFLHGSWLHALLNAVFVLVIGSRIEHMAGRSVVLATTLAGVLGGAAGHLALAAGGPGAPLLVGLSGGCMALLLLLTTLSPQSRMMPIPVSAKSLGLGILAAELILALTQLVMEIPGLFGFTIGNACHFGGGLAGWLCGRWLLRPRITLDRLRRDRARREAHRDARTRSD